MFTGEMYVAGGLGHGALEFCDHVRTPIGVHTARIRIVHPTPGALDFHLALGRGALFREFFNISRTARLKAHAAEAHGLLAGEKCIKPNDIFATAHSRHATDEAVGPHARRHAIGFPELAFY